MNSLADPYGSSASIITNSLEIKSNDLTSDQQRFLPGPQSQRSQPPSRKSSLSSRTISPLQIPDPSTIPVVKSDQHTSPNQHDAVFAKPPSTKSKTGHSRRSSFGDTRSQEQQQLEREQRHKEHDHYLSSVLDDMRAKANHILQKTGFSMAPTAGLYADRETEEADLRVVQMPLTTDDSTASTATSPSTIAFGLKAASLTLSSVPGISFAISATETGNTTN
ncbi:hypothetical protein BGZ65_006338, partial [Modicella reniformis]